MGLCLTLNKEKNKMHYDFIDAYWSVDNISYSTSVCLFDLNAYPTRDAKLANRTFHEDPSIGYGGSDPYVDCILYTWNGVFAITDIFPNGIPLDENSQKTAIYNFVKAYTGLPFEDVFEN